MRIGILTGARGAAVELRSLIQEVVQAEEDGFDSIWMAHGFASGQVFDALTVFSLAAAQTSRIAL